VDLHIGLEHFSIWIEVRLNFKSSCESRARKEKERGQNHLDRTSSVNKGFIIRNKDTIFLQDRRVIPSWRGCAKEKNVCDAHNLNVKSARLKSASSTCFACENLKRADPGISESGVVLL